ncbi:MAG: MBL fold metallo-hydrolase [Flavobacteriales bacterium]|nr:MBL fold metallo-hydrolase [Flavobacteriales bacterium]
MRNRISILLLCILLLAGAFSFKWTLNNITTAPDVQLVILGTIQDAGSPQIGCYKDCCKDLYDHPDHSRKVVSLGLIDHESQHTWLFEATPDMVSQFHLLQSQAGSHNREVPNGIFLTHAHIGHYTGLMFLGKEAINTRELPVYAMPKMEQFIKANGPWSQLVANKNISIKALENGRSIALNNRIKVTPFTVPHRDEFSETVGYRIEGPSKTALFIPDIDKWSKWSTSILAEIKKSDYAFLDATFYDGNELKNRDMSAVPHPFIVESMELFKNLSSMDKSKVHFIHFNHTNPVINQNSEAYKTVIKNGFKVASFNQIINM